MTMLTGVRVAVTRAADQADDLSARLRQAGAEVFGAPLISVVPAPIEGALRDAVRRVAAFDWVVFSSSNGVDLFVHALEQEGLKAGLLRGTRIACVGPATQNALRHHGLSAEVMPAEFTGDAIADAMGAVAEMGGQRILLARAGGARATLPQHLRAMGAHVEDVEVYRSVPDEDGAAQLKHWISAGLLDVVTFTSSSTVRHFSQHVGSIGRAVAAVIGPMTAETARTLKIDVAIEAQTHTSEGLVSAIVAYFAASGRA